MSHKVVPAKYYVWNICALTVLMTLTVMFGKMEALNFSSNPNGINLAIALAIAIMKASLIVGVFMGVAFATSLVRTFAIGGFSWLLILFLFTLTDYVNPSADWGTPYYDIASPGSSPLPDGQDHVHTGSEKALVADDSFEYVDPHHVSAGHDEGDGAEATHQEGGEDEHAAPEH